ncbi:hypothetical protein HDV05_000215 [Chytridiales sp. JEL 0842]|nr:hypothetical protein HDV05_000215 [Chytridiales sp. JEL 0842]
MATYRVELTSSIDHFVTEVESYLADNPYTTNLISTTCTFFKSKFGSTVPDEAVLAIIYKDLGPDESLSLTNQDTSSTLNSTAASSSSSTQVKTSKVVVGGTFYYLPRAIYLGPLPTGAAIVLAEAIWTFLQTIAQPPEALVGMMGVEQTSAEFADAWINKLGGKNTWEVTDRQTILAVWSETYLTTLNPPATVNPSNRHWKAYNQHIQLKTGKVYSTADGEGIPLDTAAEILSKWMTAFELEALPNQPPKGMSLSDAKLALERGIIMLWCVPRAEHWVPVSIAGLKAPPKPGGVARVGPVYTPPEERGKGYASAVVAVATSKCFDVLGAGSVMLFVDDSNPISRKVYTNLGYEVFSEDQVHGHIVNKD